MSHTNEEEHRIARETERELEAMAYNEFLIGMRDGDDTLLADTAKEYLASECHTGPDAETPLRCEAAGYRLAVTDQASSREQSLDRLEVVQSAVSGIPGVFIADLVLDDDHGVILQVFTRRPQLFASFAAPVIRAASS